MCNASKKLYVLEIFIRRIWNVLPSTPKYSKIAAWRERCRARPYFKNGYIPHSNRIVFSPISEDKSETGESDEKQARQCLWFPWTWILHNTTEDALCRRPAFTKSRRLRSSWTTSTCQPTWNTCFNFRKTVLYPRSVGGYEHQRI